MAHGDCGRCVLQTVCPYPSIFEGLAPRDREIMRRYDKIPQPFVLLVGGPERNGKDSARVTWGVRLFGDACRYWPYVIHVYEVVGQRGLGKHRLQYELRRVTDQLRKSTLWPPEAGRCSRPAIGAVSDAMSAPPERCKLRWTFHTPLRLARMPRRLGGLDLILAGKRRHQIMDYFYGSPSAEGARQSEERVEAEEFTTLASQLHPWRFQRYSGRQRRRMTLDGLVGEIVIEGPWGKSGNWLQAAPMLHIGKATSFGFGRVTWEVL